MLSNLKYINTSKIIGLIFSLSFIFFDIGSSYSLIFFLLIMLTIGIPHGSIDHLIAFINPNARKFKNKLHFFIIYISLIIFNILIWVLSPYIGLFLFLIISCYHFGETQVIGFNSTKNKVLNFVIGANLLLSMFLNNVFELQEILSSFSVFSNLDLSDYNGIFFLLLSIAILMLSVILSEIKRPIPLYAEMSILYMIFYHTDLLTSFSLFFGFSHALPMLFIEFKEMKENNFFKFYIKTLPFTLLSIGFGIFLYYFNSNLLTTDNLILFIFIIISSLTLPHVFIMKDFVKNE
jgi:beta-carotene 15,15'-dioxygenase|tara:strand:+ start:12578 stop:13453 length:876 start_codon:yes stop_codon:yes gene_type:complete